MPKFEENTESITGAIRSLEVGQTFSRSVRVAIGDKKADVNATLATLRNSMNQTVSKLRKSAKQCYKVESAPALTDDRLAMLCTVAVTRLECEDEDVDI